MGRRRPRRNDDPECTWYVCCADHEVGPMTEAHARRNAALFNDQGQCSWHHIARNGSALFDHLIARHGFIREMGQPSHLHMVHRHEAFHADDQGLNHGLHDLTTKLDVRLDERTG